MTLRTTIRNERAKLVATLLNTVAGHSISAGVIAPIAGVVLGTGLPNTPVSNEALVTALILFPIIGAALHLLASVILGEMQSDDET